jgi:hypothetical protein
MGIFNIYLVVFQIKLHLHFLLYVLLKLSEQKFWKLYIAGSALDKDSSQELGFPDWLLQREKSSGPCLRVHARREPAGSSERWFILAMEI